MLWVPPDVARDILAPVGSQGGEALLRITDRLHAWSGLMLHSGKRVVRADHAVYSRNPVLLLIYLLAYLRRPSGESLAVIFDRRPDQWNYEVLGTSEWRGFLMRALGHQSMASIASEVKMLSGAKSSVLAMSCRDINAIRRLRRGSLCLDLLARKDASSGGVAAYSSVADLMEVTLDSDGVDRSAATQLWAGGMSAIGSCPAVDVLVAGERPKPGDPDRHLFCERFGSVLQNCEPGIDFFLRPFADAEDIILRFC